MRKLVLLVIRKKSFSTTFKAFPKELVCVEWFLVTKEKTIAYFLISRFISKNVCVFG